MEPEHTYAEPGYTRPTEGVADRDRDNDSHVAKQARRLSGALNGIQEQLAMLTEQLSPVLAPGSALNRGAEDKVAPPRSPLAMQLADTAERAEGLVQQLMTLRGDVDL